MMKTFFTTCLLLSILTFPFGQSHAATAGGGFDYTFKIKGLKEGEECLLAYYLGSKQYIQDTLPVGPNGVVRYKGDEADAPGHGIYLFVMPGQNYFEFILTEPSFTLETDAASPIPSMKVKGSPENEAFFSYLRDIQGYQKRAGEIREALKEEPAEAEKAALEAESKEIDTKANAYKKEFMKSHEGLFVTKVFKASNEPVVPEINKEDGSPDYEARLANLRANFWKDIDFSDERMLRTPILEQKIKDFINKYTVQDPDSNLVSAKMIMDLAEEGGDKEVFRFCTIILTNMFAGIKKMCFDKVYVFMAGEYYVSGKAWWVDSTQLSKIKDRYYKMKYNTCGSPAANLLMEDMDGKVQQLYAIQAPITIVYFWAYDCGHCKKVTPTMLDLYNDYKDMGIKVFSVSTKKELDPWKDAVVEKGIQEFINVADPEHKTNFRLFYDIYSTPVIYVLDKEKKIIAKRLDVLSLRKFLNHELGVDVPIPDGLMPDKEMENSAPGTGGH